MAFRSDVTDDQQTKIENATADSAIRVQWWQGGQAAKTVSFRSYDAQAQGDSAGAPTSVVEQVSQSVISQHNDKPYRFLEPGKA